MREAKYWIGVLPVTLFFFLGLIAIFIAIFFESLSEGMAEIEDKLTQWAQA